MIRLEFVFLKKSTQKVNNIKWPALRQRLKQSKSYVIWFSPNVAGWMAMAYQCIPYTSTNHCKHATLKDPTCFIIAHLLCVRLLQ